MFCLYVLERERVGNTIKHGEDKIYGGWLTNNCHIINTLTV